MALGQKKFYVLELFSPKNPQKYFTLVYIIYYDNNIKNPRNNTDCINSP